MSNTPSLLGCPFCGAPAHGYAIAPHSHSTAVLRLVPELPDHPGSYVIEGQCACGSGLIGADESEVTARWNRRTPQPVVRDDTELIRQMLDALEYVRNTPEAEYDSKAALSKAQAAITAARARLGEQT